MCDGVIQEELKSERGGGGYDQYTLFPCMKLSKNKPKVVSKRGVGLAPCLLPLNCGCKSLLHGKVRWGAQASPDRHIIGIYLVWALLREDCSHHKPRDTAPVTVSRTLPWSCAGKQGKQHVPHSWMGRALSSRHLKSGMCGERVGQAEWGRQEAKYYFCDISQDSEV